MSGAPEKIRSLRSRYKQVAESVALYEAKVDSQTAQLDSMNKNFDNAEDDDEDQETMAVVEHHHEVAAITEDDLLAEEQEIRDLERKKRALEERVSSMDKDLGGLLR